MTGTDHPVIRVGGSYGFSKDGDGILCPSKLASYAPLTPVVVFNAVRFELAPSGFVHASQHKLALHTSSRFEVWANEIK